MPLRFVRSRLCIVDGILTRLASRSTLPSLGRDYCNPFFSQQTERFRKFQTKVKFYRLLKEAKTLFVPPQGGLSSPTQSVMRARRHSAVRRLREGGTRRVTGEDAPAQTNLCADGMYIADCRIVDCPRLAPSASMYHFVAIAGRRPLRVCVWTVCASGMAGRPSTSLCELGRPLQICA